MTIFILSWKSSPNDELHESAYDNKGKALEDFRDFGIERGGFIQLKSHELDNMSHDVGKLHAMREG